MLKLEKEQGFYGYHYRGRTFDCGSPEGFVEANVAFALARPDLSTRMADAIGSLLDEAPAIAAQTSRVRWRSSTSGPGVPSETTRPICVVSIVWPGCSTS